MSKFDLIEDLKASMLDSSSKFKDDPGAFARHLDVAAHDMGRVRSRVLAGSIILTADQPSYDAPSGCIGVQMLQWGSAELRDRKPWDSNWPGPLPRLSMSGDPGSRQMVFSPAPSLSQIQLLGSGCPFTYYASHHIDKVAEKTTIQPEDRSLLLLRALVEAMRDLAANGSTKASKVGSGLFSSPKNGTPAALSHMLMQSFEKQAARC